ncbi:MAG: hypothetical protein A3E79_17120 [Burkholderiales bacterium RIFCSPHIGHO2_12_FULL_61_11]|nr:MAG: hypothetical protein A3E79_17120 [Burkholderiales bacterium RIFCSPHIGHO2_12_FULL_61_11]
MQTLPSFDQSPPISGPLRFFLTAPLFAILAGVLILWSGPDLFASRWTPAALALTHLITVGFMLQVMLGAMLQLLPVVAGANMTRPLRVATLVHAAITAGALFLAAAFLTAAPLLFEFAAAFLATGVMIFVGAAARALYGIPATSPTIPGLKLALIGLSVTVFSGVLLAISLSLSLELPLLQLTNLHLGWGFVAWGCILLATVGFVVVPMFQLTPEYPVWFGRSFPMAAFGAVALWTMADLAGWATPAALLAGAVVASGAVFSMVTLNIQRRSKRARRDATHYFWQLAMASAFVACALWMVTRFNVSLGEWQGWTLLFGVLLLFGCFMSVTIGMLYKIVPFLVWLHLQNRGRGRVLAPNMKKVLAQELVDRQMLAHFVACALLLLAVLWPAWLVYPAGLSLIIANGWLLRNLVSATAVYRRHLVAIESATGLSPK